MLGVDNLYLSVTRVKRPWSRCSCPTCMSHCYCLIYHNPFRVLWLKVNFFILWLACSMRSDEAWKVMWLKKVVFILCWWGLVVVLLSANNFSTVSCSRRIVPSTFGVCIPWSCIVGQSLVWRGKGVSLFHKTISGQVAFFWFHPGWHNQQICPSIGFHAYLCISISN